MTKRAAALIEKAEQLADDERLDEALATIDLVLALKLSKATKVDALMARASIYDDRGEYEPAKADCAAALALDPESPEIYYLRAVVHETAENWAACRADLDAAIALEPRPDFYELRGLARYNGGDYEGARDDFGVAIAENEDIETRFVVYRGMAALLLERPRDAIADFTEALRREPRNEKALAQRAKAYEAAGDPKAALRDLDKLAKLIDSPLLDANRARLRR